MLLLKLVVALAAMVVVAAAVYLLRTGGFLEATVGIVLGIAAIVALLILSE